MKIGISSWTYAWAIKNGMDVYALLDKAINLKSEVLQIADNLPLYNISKETLKKVADIAKNHNIILEIGTKGIDKEKIDKYIEIAEILNVKLLRTLLHNENNTPSVTDAITILKSYVTELKNRDIVLAIENHDYYHSSQLRQIIHEVNDTNIGICLDPVNNFAQGESTREVLRNLAEDTMNFHAKDYTIKRKPSQLGFDIEGCPTGVGMLDLDMVCDALRNDISWIIELWTPWQGDIESTVKLENQWAEESIQNLTCYKQ